MYPKIYACLFERTLRRYMKSAIVLACKLLLELTKRKSPADSQALDPSQL
jgi:hypothetical protein